MNKVSTVLLSMLFGLVVSSILSTSILFEIQFFKGQGMNFELYFEKNKWMYMVLVIPTTFTLGGLGAYFYDHPNQSSKRIWQITLITVLAISLISGTMGTVVNDILMYGMEGINVEARIIWGILYSIIALPITLLVGKVIIEILAYLVAKLKNK